MTDQITPTQGSLADRMEARAMRKWNSATICPRGINRVCRLRREANKLRNRGASA